MHLEISIALNFVMSQLYNKLPRRRVNLFGEELEKALKTKFVNHWYPERPMKGSAYRCIKTGQPTDTVIALAASEANVPIGDILDNLPHEMAIWIDPGEVSYRIGEKSNIKILWSVDMTANPAHVIQSHLNGLGFGLNNCSSSSVSYNSGGGGGGSGNEVSVSALTLLHSNMMMMDDLAADREVKSFNPDAQVFQPIVAAAINGSSNMTNMAPLTLSNSSRMSNANIIVGTPTASASGVVQPSDVRSNKSVSPPFSHSPSSTSPNQHTFSLFGSPNVSGLGSGAPVSAGIKPSNGGSVNGTNMMTTAAFAQTKFGSTKLKTNSKRTHRMSPTEFSNYIKQRALAQQQAQQQQCFMNHQHQLQSSLNAGSGSNGGNGCSGNEMHHGLPMDTNSLGNISNNNIFQLQSNLMGHSRPRSISPPTDFLVNYEKYNPFESTQIWSNNMTGITSGGLFDAKASFLDFGITQKQAQQQQQQQLVA